MPDISHLTIERAHEALKKKEFSARELAEAFVARIEEKNPEINAYLEVFDDVHDAAHNADERIENGDIGALTGIPLAIKDNIVINGKVASAGSKMLEHYRATYNATVIDKLYDKYAVFLGRTNMDEFAMGGSTENSAFGVTKNPSDPTRVAGGSSGGSAAAVAMGGALAALGSDTGGSIRQPAALCGVVGLKPTYGSVSRYGLISLGSSLDQIGTFTKTVRDAEILFACIAGHDKMDSTSAPSYVVEAAREEEFSAKLTIGVPRDFVGGEGIDPHVLKNFDDSVRALKENGYKVKDIAFPDIAYALAAYYIIMPAEASANLARFDGIRYGLHKDGADLIADYEESRGEGFGAEVRRRILLGTYVLSSGYYDAYYNKAIAVRNRISDGFEKAFQEVDVIMTPTTPSAAFRIGEKTQDPLRMYLEDIFTVPANIAGVPAMSVPSGTREIDGVSLPLGVQVIAPHFREDVLFAVGKDIERFL